MRTTAVAHPRLAIESPLVAWSPYDDEPDFESVSRRILARWRQPDCLIEVYWASAKTANLFGSAGGRRPNVTHLNLTKVCNPATITFKMANTTSSEASRLRRSPQTDGL